MVYHTKLTMIRIYLIVIFIWIIHFIDFFPLWFLFPSFLSITLLSTFIIFFICCKFWFPNFFASSPFFLLVFICFILRVITAPNLGIKETKLPYWGGPETAVQHTSAEGVVYTMNTSWHTVLPCRHV